MTADSVGPDISLAEDCTQMPFTAPSRLAQYHTQSYRGDDHGS